MIVVVLVVVAAVEHTPSSFSGLNLDYQLTKIFTRELQVCSQIDHHLLGNSRLDLCFYHSVVNHLAKFGNTRASFVKLLRGREILRRRDLIDLDTKLVIAHNNRCERRVSLWVKNGQIRWTS